MDSQRFVKKWQADHRVSARRIHHLDPAGSIHGFSAKIVGDELVLRIPLNAKPEKSSSGKTLVVASTYGNKETDCVVDGKKVIVGVNAYIPKT